jgi:hypothetical protein
MSKMNRIVMPDNANILEAFGAAGLYRSSNKRMSKMIKYFLFTLSLLLSISSPIFSQTPLIWHNLTSLEGRAIAVDPFRKGDIWIAGSGGLKRYHSITDSWESYTTADGLSKIWCTSLFVEENQVWIGTESAGANLFDLGSGKITPFLQLSFDPSHSDYYSTVYSFYPEAEVTWVGSDVGLLKVDRSSLDILQRYTMADDLGENYVFDIISGDDYLWLATGFGGTFIWPPETGGLSRFDKSNDIISNFQLTGYPGDNYFRDLTQTGDVIWIAGNSGLLTFNKIDHNFSVILGNIINSPNEIVSDNSSLWCIGFSANGGEYLFQVDINSGELINQLPLPYHYTSASLAVDSKYVYIIKGNSFYQTLKSDLQLQEITTPFLPGQYCYGIIANGQKAFAGSRNYLIVIDQGDFPGFSMESLPDSTASVRAVDMDEDRLWVSTDRGLFCYDIQTLSLLDTYLSGKTVYFTVPDHQYVWASEHVGLYKINPQTGQSIFKNLTDDLNTFGSPKISSLILDENVVWLSFRGQENEGGLISGIVELDKNTLMTLAVRKMNIGSYKSAIETLIDFDDYLLCSGGVISKFSKTNLTFDIFIDHSADKMFLNGSLLWATIPDEGIKVFNIKDQQEKIVLNELNGLLHNRVTDLYISNQYAWFSTYGGISILDLGSVMDLSRDENATIPRNFVLHQNFPNPFNPETSICFELPKTTQVVLKIFNIRGQEVKKLVDMPLEPGYHTVHWDGKDNRGKMQASGVYFYHFKAEEFQQTRKMLFVH